MQTRCRTWVWVGLFLGICLPIYAFAAPPIQEGIIQAVRVWPSPGAMRVVFDLNHPVNYEVFALTGPNRLVIDFQNTNLWVDLTAMDWKGGLIEKARFGRHQGSRIRVVLDLKQAAKVSSFTLPPNEEYGYRLVIDLKQLLSITVSAGQSPPQSPAPLVSTPLKPAPKMVEKPFVVVVDPGHGGEDPGARGRYGSREKDIALSIAQKLVDLINITPNMQAILTREGDYYVGLRDRMNKARTSKADLFVSVHADSFTNPNARGASVFTLSQHGASSEAARWLASQENNSDLLGGVPLEDKDPILTQVLLDLSQAATIKASMKLGKSVLTRLGHHTVLHQNKVQRAGFLVLKSPDVPSILVETGFISHAPSELKLKSFSYQQELASAIYRGIVQYLRKVKR